MLLENKMIILRIDIFKKFIIFFNMCSFYAIFFKIKLPIINKSQSLFYITIKFYINTILHIPTFHVY